jgi:hypothetical protein
MGLEGKEWDAMKKLLLNISNRSDTEPFREAVDWKGLRLHDYPEIIKRPMDLGLVKKKIDNAEYKHVQEAAEDIRLVWRNCMTYNMDGSDFHRLAKRLSKMFEEKYKNMLKELDMESLMGSGPGSADGGEPTLEEKRAFAKSLYKLEKEQLGKIIIDLDDKCPAAITRNEMEDELEINVDNITSTVFRDVFKYSKSCAGGGDKKKKKSSSETAPAAKKSRSS